MEGVKILAHPNIPKPLHGLNPRRIYGNAWWNKVRKIAYAQKSNHCWACGVHSSQAEFHHWLEAHEFYEIDYEHGRVYFKEVVAICHACHNFIHSQRLLAVMNKGEISRGRAYKIIDRGLDLCFEHGVTPFCGAKDIIEELGIDWHNYWYPDGETEWGKWRLILDGHEYEPLFPTIEEWAEYYEVDLLKVMTDKYREKEHE
jgi:hypothetical protein